MAKDLVQTHVPPLSRWKMVRFKISYRSSKRTVLVLAPFPSYAKRSSGAAPDEEIIEAPLDSLSALLNFATTPKRPTTDELVQFYTEMAQCLRAGLSPLQGIALASSQCKTPIFRGALSGVRYLMEQKGMSLGEATSAFPMVFDGVATSMISAGQTSGRIELVFDRMAKRTNSQAGLVRKFVSAMIQPGITFGLLAGSLAIAHFKVLPTMARNFAQIRTSSGQLPVPTAVMMACSDFVRNNPVVWVLLVASVVGLVVFWRRIVSANLFQRTLVRVPVIGNAYRMLIVARSLETLALLSEAGVAFETAYRMTAKVSGHYEYREYFEAVYRHIAQGRKPYAAFLAERHRIGPEGLDLAFRMEAASVTGDISSSLSRTATVMQEIADNRLDALPKLVNPMANVIAAVVVVFMALAIFLPGLQLLLDTLKAGVGH